MIIWALFLFVLGILFIFYNSSDRNPKKYIFFIITIWIIYFSGFRDGLGMDYIPYEDQCLRVRKIPQFLSLDFLLSEPIFKWFTNWIATSDFSPVFFFLVTSIIINFLSLYVYYKSSSFVLAAFFYLCFPALFILSFNTLRQFVVAAVFLFVAYLWHTIPTKITIKRIFLLLLLGLMFFIHKSSIILIPIMLLCRGTVRPIIATIILIVSFVIPLSSLPFISTILLLIDSLDYNLYLDYDNMVMAKYSLTNIYLNCLVILSMFMLHKQINFSKKDNHYTHWTDFYKFSYMMIFFSMICFNLCANGFYIMYRVAIYFIIFLPVIVGILPKFFKYQSLAYAIVIIPTIILFSFRLMIGDEYLLPQTILPVFDIFKH